MGQHLTEVLLHGQPQRRATLELGTEELGGRKLGRVVLQLRGRIPHAQDGTQDEEKQHLAGVAATAGEELRGQDAIETLDQAVTRDLTGSAEVAGLDGVAAVAPAGVGEGCGEKKTAKIGDQAVGTGGGILLELQAKKTGAAQAHDAAVGEVEVGVCEPRDHGVVESCRVGSEGELGWRGDPGEQIAHGAHQRLGLHLFGRFVTRGRCKDVDVGEASAHAVAKGQDLPLGALDGRLQTGLARVFKRTLS